MKSFANNTDPFRYRPELRDTITNLTTDDIDALLEEAAELDAEHDEDATRENQSFVTDTLNTVYVTEVDTVDSDNPQYAMLEADEREEEIQRQWYANQPKVITDNPFQS